MMDDDCAQRGDCPVEGLTERHLFLLREVTIGGVQNVQRRMMVFVLLGDAFFPLLKKR